MEMIGFKVDKSFIQSFVTKFRIPEMRPTNDVSQFLTNFKGYLKIKAFRQMQFSDDPVENFEYELDKLIGSEKLQRGFKRIVEKFVPSNGSLEFLIEKKIFESEVFK